MPILFFKMARVVGGEVVSGRLGGRVYRNVGGEGFVSVAPQAVDPRTQAQLGARARLEMANRLWVELPLDAMARWRAWAAVPRPYVSPKGRKASARGDLAFKGLAAKYLQVHGGSVVPTEPPSSVFLGDGVVVTVSPSFHSGERKGTGDGELGSAASALSPQPPLSQAKEGEPGIVFAASSANAPGVVTELLTQRLAARHRKPHPEEYRTRRFVGFGDGGLGATVECAPGAYACAARFVRAGTGQASAMVELGVVEVGP